MGLIVSPYSKGPAKIGLQTPRQIRDLVAYHESRHVETEEDEVSVCVLSDDFVQDLERNGNRRAIMHDLGFDVEKDAAPIEHLPLQLEKGYCRFDRTLVEGEKGMHEPKGYVIEKGKGKGHIFMQGDKNASD